MERSPLVDEETGENILVVLQEDGRARNNAETGEPEVAQEPQRWLERTRGRRVPFQIPREMIKPVERSAKKLTETYEPVPVGASFGQINPILLFLPAIFYSRWCLAILMLVEVIIHVWAHSKNKKLKNAGVYFRSPFHGISSEFCALCQDETCVDRVGKMHRMRMHKFLKHCNYVKRVVT